MDKFDDQYLLLEQLYEDSRYPDFLIDKIKYVLVDFINYLETNPYNLQEIEDKIYDTFTTANNLPNDYLDNDDESENIAKECISRDMEYIIQWFHLPITLETVLAEREWE